MERKINKTKEGLETRPLFIKHLSLEDWEMVEQIKRLQDLKSAADAVRWALRKSIGRV